MGSLKNLPIHFIKSGKYFFVNSKTGARIHISQIEKHIPKQPEVKPTWINQYYDN